MASPVLQQFLILLLMQLLLEGPDAPRDLRTKESKEPGSDLVRTHIALDQKCGRTDMRAAGSQPRLI